jgi:hypothetical protein
VPGVSVTVGFYGETILFATMDEKDASWRIKEVQIAVLAVDRGPWVR